MVTGDPDRCEASRDQLLPTEARGIGGRAQGVVGAEEQDSTRVRAAPVLGLERPVAVLHPGEVLLFNGEDVLRMRRASERSDEGAGTPSEPPRVAARPPTKRR